MRILTAAFALSLIVSPAVAEEGGNTNEMKAALAAGYKAAFTCSATFNAGQSMAEIQANELTGIYPDYRTLMAGTGRAEINDSAKTVSVSYSRSMPPRIAAWRPGMGCTQLPIGATAEQVSALPSLNGWRDLGAAPDRSSAIGTNVTITPNIGFFDGLEIPVSFAFDGSTYGSGTQTSAVVIAQNGQIVAEQYARGIDANTPQRTWSVAKSISATVIGAAIWDGKLSLDHEAVLPEWNKGADPRRKITLRHLLHMASGLDSGASGSRTDRLYFGGATVADNAATRSLEAKPGSRFKYANIDTLLAMRALRAAIGDENEFRVYPYSDVLWKIGANNTILEVDWNGDYLSSSQVWTTARDLARIGQLYLQNGKWGDEQILPRDWMEFVSKRAPAQPGGDFGYGAQFWLLDRSPGVPPDTFAAMGHRGQYLVIIPSRQVVIVRRGYDASGGTRFDAAAFTRDVVTALDAADRRKQQALDAERAAEEATDAEAAAAEEAELQRIEDRKAARRAARSNSVGAPRIRN